MKIIQLPQWGRVGLSLTMQFMAVFVVLGTVNGFAGNYVHNPQTSFGVQQQRRTVSGTVTDANGEAVIGANVMEKGTTNGTVTDSDGRFSLTIESEGVLLISYIGYLGQEVNTAGRSSFDIVLREDSRSLEEVVVVGYGTQKKVNLTGALASVGRDEVKSISTANLVTGLAGKLPGLKVTQRTGEPGAYTTSYDIRGFGAPLIVVDGIVRDGSDFARLDPHDIESITILKDASAAVYGIKAANGVILVTTKKGETGKPTISYTGAYEWQRISNTPTVGTAYEFAVLTTENEINGGRAPGETTYTPDDIQKFKDGTYPSTDWYHVVARDYTTLNRHNLNISGGNERIRYFTSVGYLGEQGLWKSGDLNYHKYNIRSNVTGKITDGLEIQVNLDGMLENKNEPGEAAWNVIKFTWMNIPTYPVYANDNLWARKEFTIDIDQFFAGLSKNAQVNSGGLYEDANQSVIGRLNYDYLSRYLFEFAFNYSGSSKFPKGKRWGFEMVLGHAKRTGELKYVELRYSIPQGIQSATPTS